MVSFDFMHKALCFFYFIGCSLKYVRSPSPPQGALQKAAGSGSDKGADVQGGRDRPVPEERGR